MINSKVLDAVSLPEISKKNLNHGYATCCTRVHIHCLLPYKIVVIGFQIAVGGFKCK